MLLNALSVLLQLGAAISAPPDQLREARAAQARFELVRRMNLPRERYGRSSPRCDATIGRFCYWHDSTETPAVPEPRRITDARAELLAVLDSAAARDPSIGWIVGQRVRYLIEGDRPGDAVAAARGGHCRDDRWWCAALEGLALHVSERYEEADSAFALALGSMPAGLRCEWLDLRIVADVKLARAMSRATCDERAAMADQIWVLSQPLWSTRGNDLRTEHFARHTMAAVLSESATTRDMAWGADNRELLLRYGWSEWFTQHERSQYQPMSRSITGHDREPSYMFFPDLPDLSSRGPPRLTRDSWRLRERAAPTRYAPRHIKGLRALQHQLARFPRGDSMLVAVAYRVSDSALAGDSTLATLAVLHGGRLGFGAERAPGSLGIMVPRDTVVASVEVRGWHSRHAERARYTIDPIACSAWCLSDLLLFSPRDGSDERDVGRVATMAVAATVFSARDPVGVFWEIEPGPSAGDASRVAGASPVWLSLTVTPVRVRLARRIATRLRLAPAIAPVRLRWHAVLGGLREGRSVALRLPSAARGRYQVVLTMEPPGALPISVSREIEVVR